MTGRLAEIRSYLRYQNALVKLTPRAPEIIRRFNQIQRDVECPHSPSHLLKVATEFLRSPADGVLVEAGCFKGGSTAKLSLIAQLTNRKLVVFDSFQGLPANREAHSKTIHGDDIRGWFREGEFSGALREVQTNVATHGDLNSCQFIEGWFEDTMPSFGEPIAGAFLDVDLAMSTRTCLKHLYPLIRPGGVLISQDGDFPLVLDVFGDPQFWEVELGVEPPVVEGLGQEKLLVIRK